MQGEVNVVTMIFTYVATYVCLVTGNIELSATKCDKSEQLANSTDSSNYYSVVKNQQPCAKQTSSSHVVYKVST